jgi:hypothetical protein
MQFPFFPQAPGSAAGDAGPGWHGIGPGRGAACRRRAALQRLSERCRAAQPGPAITAAERGVGPGWRRHRGHTTRSPALGAAREQVNSGLPRPQNRTYELSMELETGGKRSARIRAARSQVRLAEAEVEDSAPSCSPMLPRTSHRPAAIARRWSARSRRSMLCPMWSRPTRCDARPATSAP